MTKEFILFCALALFLVGYSPEFSAAQNAVTPRLEILLSPIPPLVMKKDGVNTGLLWDMATVIAERFSHWSKNKISVDQIILPWNRAYRELAKSPGKIMLQMARTKSREQLFDWVIPTTKLTFAFVRTTRPAINTLEEAKALPSIAVYRGSQLEKFLKSKKFSANLVRTNNSQVGARMLNSGNASAWYASIEEALWLRKKGVIKKSLIIGKPIQVLPVWAVVSLGTSPLIIMQLSKIIKMMKTDGTVDRLKVKYGLNYS